MSSLYDDNTTTWRDLTDQLTPKQIGEFEYCERENFPRGWRPPKHPKGGWAQRRPGAVCDTAPPPEAVDEPGDWEEWGDDPRRRAPLERFSGTCVESVRPLDIARFLGRSRLKPNSRAAYYGYIHSFFRWWSEDGSANTAAKLPRPKAPKGVPRPITDEQLRNLLAISRTTATGITGE